jgi:hypothetical protein
MFTLDIKNIGGDGGINFLPHYSNLIYHCWEKLDNDASDTSLSRLNQLRDSILAEYGGKMINHGQGNFAIGFPDEESAMQFLLAWP